MGWRRQRYRETALGCSRGADAKVGNAGLQVCCLKLGSKIPDSVQCDREIEMADINVIERTVEFGAKFAVRKPPSISKLWIAVASFLHAKPVGDLPSREGG